MLRPALAAVCLFACAAMLSAAEFTIEKADDGLTIKQDGQLVTRYPLAEVNRALAEMASGSVMKAVLVPDATTAG